MKADNSYDRKYAGEEYYWGRKPSAICDRVMEILHPTPDRRTRLLDLGCGEGRNAVYFAKCGYDVVGLDISQPGLRKADALAHECGVQIKTVHADITDFDFDGTYDVLFSTGTLHYLLPESREDRLAQWKEASTIGSIHAMSVLVYKPFMPPAPDAEEDADLFKSGELLNYYWDWEILFSVEEIFDCISSGIPHKHAINRIIARRP